MHDWGQGEERPPPGTTLRDQYRNLQERSRLRAYLVVAAIVFLIVGTIAVFWHRGEYGVWPGTSAPPERLNYCGRVYGGGQTTTVPDGTPLYHAYTFSPPLAAHHEVYADTPIVHAPDRVCAMGLLLHTSGNHYASYTLYGGP